MKLPAVRLPKGLTRLGGKLLLKLQHNKPELCIVTGILLGTGAVVMTGVTTWKNKETLKCDIEDIRCNRTLIKEPCDDKEAVKERKNELVKSYGSFVKHAGKTYWLPLVLTVSAAGLVWGGRTSLRRELSAMTALAATLSDRYSKLYNKIREEFGDEKAQELAYGVKMTDFVDGDTGEVIKAPLIDKKHLISPYATYFDPGEFDEDSGEWIWKNYEWQPNKLLNIAKFTSCQNLYNNLLRSRGWVLWGEVADYLGLKPDPNWYRVGWIDDGSGTKYIELGVLEGPHQLEVNKKFTDERDKWNIALVDPNVDGCIDMVFEKIESFDYRCGRRSKKKKHIPTEKEMFGEEFAKKLAKER